MTNRITKTLLALALTLAVATPAMAAVPAPDTSADEAYAALLGVQAEQLSASDMDAIHGALTGQDLFNQLLASAQLIKDPVLQAKVVAQLTANQASLVKFFDFILRFRR